MTERFVESDGADARAAGQAHSREALLGIDLWRRSTVEHARRYIGYLRSVNQSQVVFHGGTTGPPPCKAARALGRAARRREAAEADPSPRRDRRRPPSRRWRLCRSAPSRYCASARVRRRSSPSAMAARARSGRRRRSPARPRRRPRGARRTGRARKNRHRHGQGEGEQPVVETIGELAAQDGAHEIADREHEQRDCKPGEREVIGHLQERRVVDGGELRSRRARSRRRPAGPARGPKVRP